MAQDRIRYLPTDDIAISSSRRAKDPLSVHIFSMLRWHIGCKWERIYNSGES